MLNKEKNQKIEENFKAIKTQVIKNIKKSKLGQNRARLQEFTEEAIGKIAIAADEYDETKDKIGFVPSVAYRAVLRLQDDQRRQTKYYQNTKDHTNIENVSITTPSGTYFNEVDNRLDCENIKEVFKKEFPNSKENEIYHKIFDRYLYPYLSGEEQKTSREIAEEIGISHVNFIQKLKDEKMQKFARKFIEI